MKHETVKNIATRVLGVLACLAKTAAITHALNVLVAAEFGLIQFSFFYTLICLFAVDIVTGNEHNFLYTDDEEKRHEYFATIVSSGILSIALYLYQ